MKRFLLFILAAIMCLSAAACSGTSQDEGGATGGGTAQSTPRPGYKMWTSGRTAPSAVEERKTESNAPEEGNAEEFTVANYFSDDMIVPKEKEIVIWGTAPESQNGKIVAAEFKGLRGSAAIENGAWKLWMVTIYPMFNAEFTEDWGKLTPTDWDKLAAEKKPDAPMEKKPWHLGDPIRLWECYPPKPYAQWNETVLGRDSK